MSYGIIDTSLVDLGANIDAGYLAGWRNRAGLDYPQILAQMQARVQAYNATLDPRLSGLLAPATTELYTDGSGVQPFIVGPGSEFEPPRPQSTDMVQYELPIRKWDAGLGWTEDGMEEMSQARLTLDLNNLVAGFTDRRYKEALRRLLSKAEFPVGNKTATVSPGFAGSGSGLNIFTNNYPDGTSTAGSYSLYYRIASGDLDTDLLPAVQELRRWNPEAQFELRASQALIDVIAAINPGNATTGFVAASPNLVQVGTGTAAAQVDSGMYVGVLFGDVKVRKADPGVPANYISIAATYGSVNPRNPLVFRYDPIRGRGLRIKSRQLRPLVNAWAEEWYGYGPNNRVGHLAVYVNASGPYQDPNIS